MSNSCLPSPGKPETAALIGLREISSGNVLSQQRQVSVEALDDFITKAETDIRAHLRASGFPNGELMSMHFMTSSAATAIASSRVQ